MAVAVALAGEVARGVAAGVAGMAVGAGVAGMAVGAGAGWGAGAAGRGRGGRRFSGVVPAASDDYGGRKYG